MASKLQVALIYQTSCHLTCSWNTSHSWQLAVGNALVLVYIVIGNVEHSPSTLVWWVPTPFVVWSLHQIYDKISGTFYIWNHTRACLFVKIFGWCIIVCIIWKTCKIYDIFTRYFFLKSPCQWLIFHVANIFVVFLHAYSVKILGYQLILSDAELIHMLFVCYTEKTNVIFDIHQVIFPDIQDKIKGKRESKAKTTHQCFWNQE